jgi:hypothetical protein
MRRHLPVSPHRRASRLAGALICLVAVAGAPATAGAASARHWHRHPVRPARAAATRHRPRHPARPAHPRARVASDPVSNRSLSQATLWNCQVSPAAADCVRPVLAAIDRARAAEGIAAMRLPSGFTALSQPRQLLVIANLERSDRGLTPAIGLSRGLNQNALAAARINQDPVPNPFYGNAYGSNWAGGLGSTLAVDFLWMYDDGPGSYNIDCRSAHDAGCWGHRRNLLYPYQSPLAMGAAVIGTSMTEVFVGADGQTGRGQADAPMAVRAVRR